MYRIEIFLPLYDNEGRAFARGEFDRVRRELTDRFGGVTAFTRAPAEGVWKEGGEETRDQIVIFEVMAERLDREWWGTFRAELERRFRQEELLIRASEIERL
jgi:hypothetical protein